MKIVPRFGSLTMIANTKAPGRLPELVLDIRDPQNKHIRQHVQNKSDHAVILSNAGNVKRFERLGALENALRKVFDNLNQHVAQLEKPSSKAFNYNQSYLQRLALVNEAHQQVLGVLNERLPKLLGMLKNAAFEKMDWAPFEAALNTPQGQPPKANIQIVYGNGKTVHRVDLQTLLNSRHAD